MDSFREFIEAVATPPDVVQQVRMMFLDGMSRKNIMIRTGIHSDTLDKIVAILKGGEVSPISKFGKEDRNTPDNLNLVMRMSREGKTKYEIHRATGLSYPQLNAMLGVEGTGAPRKLTPQQKSKIVYAATKLFYSDSEIARLLGIQNRMNVTKIVAPYLTPEIVEARKNRLKSGFTPADKAGVKFDDIPEHDEYEPATQYDRPLRTQPNPNIVAQKPSRYARKINLPPGMPNAQ